MKRGRRLEAMMAVVLVILVSAGFSYPPRRLTWATFQAGDVKIAYVMRGAGTPVVLVHGWLSSSGINWQLPGTMALLARDYQVIALDVARARAVGQADGGRSVRTRARRGCRPAARPPRNQESPHCRLFHGRGDCGQLHRQASRSRLIRNSLRHGVVASRWSRPARLQTDRQKRPICQGSRRVRAQPCRACTHRSRAQVDPRSRGRAGRRAG